MDTTWNNYTRVVAPDADKPLLDIEILKTHLRVRHSGDDDYITGLIDMATSYIEGPKGTGQACLTQSWRLSLDTLPEAVSLPLGPVQAITGVTYLDAAGDVQTLAPTLYGVDLDSKPARLFRKANAVYPAALAQPGSVKVTMTVGYGDDPTDVPANLRHAASLLVAHYYRNRGDVEPAGDVAQTVANLLEPFRVHDCG